MKEISGSKIIFTLIIFLICSKLYGQSLNDNLKAYYPLRVEKHTQYKIWLKKYAHDASGNGKHGQWYKDGVEDLASAYLFNWTGSTDETIFQINENNYKQGWFPEDQDGSAITLGITRPSVLPEGYQSYADNGVFITNSLYKSTNDNIAIKIPDPYDDKTSFTEFRSSGATVTFWIKYESVNNPTSQTSQVISIPWFDVSINEQNLQIYNNNVQKYDQTVFNQGDGWYFVSLIMFPTGDEEDLVGFYYEYFKYSSSFDPSAISQVTGNSAATTLIRTSNDSKLFSNNFKGGLRDVMFFDSYFGSGSNLDVVTQTWKVSQKTNGLLNYSIYKGRSTYSHDLDGGETNRFGVSGKATSNPNINIGSDPFNGYDNKKGYTVSFWTKKIDQVTNFFSIKDNANAILGGIRQSGQEKMGIYRYYPSGSEDPNPKTGTAGSWFLPFWSPASVPADIVDDQWYHVVVSFHPDVTYFYAGHMTGEVKWYQEYMGTINQDLTPPRASNWIIGDGVSSSNVMDDFKIFNWPMSIFEVQALHTEEKSDFENDAPESENIDIFLFIGQSNGAGRAPATSSDLGIINRTYLFNANNVFEPAQLMASYLPPVDAGDVVNNLYPGLNRYSTVKKAPDNLGMQRLNPAYNFAKTLQGDVAQQNTIGIVSNARGASASIEWTKGFDPHDMGNPPCMRAPPYCTQLYNASGGSNPDSPNYYKNMCANCPTLETSDPTKWCNRGVATQYYATNNAYNEAIDRVISALTNYPNATLKAVIVAQGEHDRDQSAVWRTNWQQIVSDMRNDLHSWDNSHNYDQLPFIFTQMGKWDSQNCIFNTGYVTNNGGVGQHLNPFIEAFATDDTDSYEEIYYVSSEGLQSLQGMATTDSDFHFDKPSMLTLGQRVACVYSTLTNEGTSCSTPASARLTEGNPEESNEFFRFNIYPNPSDGSKLNIPFFLQEQGDVQVIMYALTGQKIYDEVYIGSPGNQEITLSFTDQKLRPGLYEVMVISPEFERKETIIIEY